MLYYIVPPIIIVLSLSLLTWYLFRKVSLLEQGIVNTNSGAKGFYGGKVMAVFSAIGRFFLAIAEWLMRRVKLLSLRFHNISNDWVRSIRAKREAAKAEKVPSEHFKRAEKVENAENTKLEDNEVVFARKSKMNKVAPMVRREATMPQKKFENEQQQTKEKMEDVLIKRIAMNPRDIEAYERLGDYYSDQENAKDALECYRQVLKLSPAHYKVKLKIRKLERLLTKR